jgi:hypothetical protein
MTTAVQNGANNSWINGTSDSCSKWRQQQLYQ